MKTNIRIGSWKHGPIFSTNNNIFQKGTIS
nr:MAG TPA: hypothetical protein [Caudoviricetes sp.]